MTADREIDRQPAKRAKIRIQTFMQTQTHTHYLTKNHMLLAIKGKELSIHTTPKR